MYLSQANDKSKETCLFICMLPNWSPCTVLFASIWTWKFFPFNYSHGTSKSYCENKSFCLFWKSVVRKQKQLNLISTSVLSMFAIWIFKVSFQKAILIKIQPQVPFIHPLKVFHLFLSLSFLSFYLLLKKTILL